MSSSGRGPAIRSYRLLAYSLKRVSLVVLVAVAVVSCGEQGVTPDGDSSRESGVTGGETTVSEEPGSRSRQAGEETTGSGPSREVAASSNTSASPATGANGMVSSASPLATEAGLEVLEDGGTAFDAAVTVAASLGVVEPMMSGIGGYGAMVVYDAGSGEMRTLSSSTRTPEALDPSVFRPTTPGYLRNRQGAAAISTPGAVNDWEALWREYGELEWERLIEPAVAQAEEGFVLDEENAGWIRSRYNDFPAQARQVYGEDGAPLVAGDRLVQEDLAGSLRLISERGADAVYGGELGRAMASAAQANGGFLTVEDIESTRPEWRAPVSVDYRGSEVFTTPPPNTSWNTLTRLGVMSRLDPAALGHNSDAYLETYARVTEQAYAERAEYAADPEVEPTPLEMLLSEPYWAEQAAELDLARAEGNPDASDELAVVEGDREDGQGHTTHFVVADRQGNVVSATQTLGNIFGSRVMAEDTGIWLNNSISYSTFEPPGNPLDASPGRQRLVGISPTIVARDGRPFLALGTHGGYYISQTTPQMLMNVLDFDMDVQRAISAPRISYLEPGRLAVEAGIPSTARAGLSSLGYDVYVDELGLGNAHGLTVEYGPGGEPVRFTGGADPRAAGLAEGL